MPVKINDRRFLLWWVIFLILITTIPYLVGFDTAKGTNTIFSGFVFGVEDGNSYIAKMLSGSTGDWLFRTPYSAYPQTGFFAFFPYLFLGKLAAAPDLHTQLIALFHIFRWLGIIFLVFEIYAFASAFTDSKNIKRLVVVLATIGGGLGWLGVFLTSRLPLDFYSPEAFGFLSILGLPHLLFARGFLLKSIRSDIIRDQNSKPLNSRVRSGIYLLLSGVFQPLNIPLGWLIVLSWRIFKWVKQKESVVKDLLRETFWLIVIPLPLFLYNAYMFLFDPYLSSWEGQNIINSPPPIDFLMAYLIGFLSCLWVVIKKKKIFSNQSFLLTWILLLPVLAYLPINLQRRLTDGYWVVLALFIAAIISEIRKPVMRMLAIFFMTISSIFLMVTSTVSMKNVSPPLYHDRNLVAAFLEIDKAGQPKDVVLAPYEISNILPAYIPMRVVNGHGPESKNLVEIEKIVDDFYAQKNPNTYQDFFDEFHIRFMIFPADQQIEPKAEWVKNGEIVFSNQSYLVFERSVVPTK